MKAHLALRPSIGTCWTVGVEDSPYSEIPLMGFGNREAAIDYAMSLANAGGLELFEYDNWIG